MRKIHSVKTGNAGSCTKRQEKSLRFINFEDSRFSDHLNTDTLDRIFDTYRETINPDGEVYLFLDEVQQVARWEKWVRTAHDLNKAKIYLTSSSSQLLSGEIATAISGRYLHVEVFPLSFHEFLAFKRIPCQDIGEYLANRIIINRMFREYLRYGGFPRIVSFDEDLKKEELMSYYTTILLKDIVARYRLRNFDLIKKMVEYLLTNDTQQNSIHNVSTGQKVSYDTVQQEVR